MLRRMAVLAVLGVLAVAPMVRTPCESRTSASRNAPTYA